MQLDGRRGDRSGSMTYLHAIFIWIKVHRGQRMYKNGCISWIEAKSLNLGTGH